MKFTSHLASDTNNNLTACGEPWQGWQEPFDADLHSDVPALGPIDYPEHGDLIRMCGACRKVSMQ